MIPRLIFHKIEFMRKFFKKYYSEFTYLKIYLTFLFLLAILVSVTYRIDSALSELNFLFHLTMPLIMFGGLFFFLWSIAIIFSSLFNIKTIFKSRGFDKNWWNEMLRKQFKYYALRMWCVMMVIVVIGTIYDTFLK